MKSWLMKFKISNALDKRQPPSPAVERATVESDELRRFAGNCRAVEHALKTQLTRPEESQELHDSIMRAVRNAQPERVPVERLTWPSWIPAASLGLVIFLALLFASQLLPGSHGKLQPANSPSLAAAGSAIELGGNLVHEAPDIVMAPLSEEMRKLDDNLAAAKTFLLASLP
jgi:hypothetical protein